MQGFQQPSFQQPNLNNQFNPMNFPQQPQQQGFAGLPFQQQAQAPPPPQPFSQQVQQFMQTHPVAAQQQQQQAPPLPYQQQAPPLPYQQQAPPQQMFQQQQAPPQQQGFAGLPFQQQQAPPQQQMYQQQPFQQQQAPPQQMYQQEQSMQQAPQLPFANQQAPSPQQQLPPTVDLSGLAAFVSMNKPAEQPVVHQEVHQPQAPVVEQVRAAPPQQLPAMIIFGAEHDPNTGIFSMRYPTFFSGSSGTRYNSVWQYVLAWKALMMNDVDMYSKIMAVEYPATEPVNWQAIQAAMVEIEKLGSQVKNFNVAAWNEKCRAILHQATCYKFCQNDRLAHAILNSGDAFFIEASADRVLGAGFSPQELQQHPVAEWGHNLHGQVLNEVRATLRQYGKLPWASGVGQGESSMTRNNVQLAPAQPAANAVDTRSFLEDNVPAAPAPAPVAVVAPIVEQAPVVVASAEPKKEETPVTPVVVVAEPIVTASAETLKEEVSVVAPVVESKKEEEVVAIVAEPKKEETPVVVISTQTPIPPVSEPMANFL